MKHSVYIVYSPPKIFWFPIHLRIWNRQCIIFIPNQNLRLCIFEYYSYQCAWYWPMKMTTSQLRKMFFHPVLASISNIYIVFEYIYFHYNNWTTAIHKILIINELWRVQQRYNETKFFSKNNAYTNCLPLKINWWNSRTRSLTIAIL